MPKTRPSNHSREVILRHAFREILRNGYRGANISRIAKRSSMTKGALYYYFKDKRDLALAVIDDVVSDNLHDAWIAPLSSCDNPIDCLQEIIRRSMLDARKPDARFGSVLVNLSLEMSPRDASFRTRLNGMIDNLMAEIADALRRGQKNGQVSVFVDPFKTSALIMSMVFGNKTLARAVQNPIRFRDSQQHMIEYLEFLRPNE